MVSLAICASGEPAASFLGIFRIQKSAIRFGACEVGEVLELFRYRTNEQVGTVVADPDGRRELAHELADCLWVLLRLADVCGVDLASALHEKVELAAHKYPVERAFGRPDKYTTYLTPEGESG